MSKQEFDFVIIGSGFGGAVSAMRLAEKGYSVSVLEEGKRWKSENLPKSNWNIKRYLWAPFIRCFGIQAITLLKGVMVLHGKGVGGGSLVYANTLMKPTDDVLANSDWPKGINWLTELTPHYETARKMLGVTTNPLLEIAEEALRKTGANLGVESTFHPTEVGVFFGKPNETIPDPYFGGKGPERSGCNGCGGCMVGCRYNAKNTLDKNYLWFAEKAGAKIFPETRAFRLTPLANGSYRVDTKKATALFNSSNSAFHAKKVIIAAGVLGTVKFLLENRNEFITLPRISKLLGHAVRTNGECLSGATSLLNDKDYSRGIAIGAAIHPDANTKIEAVKYPSGSSFMRLLAVPLTPNGSRWTRPLKMIQSVFLTLGDQLQLIFKLNWAKRTVILLTMQSLDTKLHLFLRKGVFGIKLSGQSDGQSFPSFLPVAQKATKILAKEMSGVAQNVITEVLLATPTTAHILGGCRMGNDSNSGVVNYHHEVFNYPGLFVCDGSVVPVNLGVNPSLTITALAERFVSQFSQKEAT